MSGTGNPNLELLHENRNSKIENRNPEGHDFGRAEEQVARSTTLEGARGNPLRVSPPSHGPRDTGHGSLEGAWIEVFRAGDYGERGTWTPEDLDQLAISYNPRLHAAPVVLGHPADDAPAYAWVTRLRRAGQSLWAQLGKVDPALEALLRAGRFAARSVALYTHFPPTGGPYLRHLGFLGAAAPAIKGLAPVRFADAPAVSFEFPSDQCPATSDLSEPAHGPRAAEQREHPREAPMPEFRSRVETLLDHLRSFFTAAPAPTASNPAAGLVLEAGPEGDAGLDSPSLASSASSASSASAASRASLSSSAAPVPVIPSASEESAFAERLAQLEQRLNSLAAARQAAEEKLHDANARLSRAQARDRQEQIANFVETLRARGRFPPAFDRWGVREFMERLAAADPPTVIPSEARDLLVEKQIPRLRPAGSARNDSVAGQAQPDFNSVAASAAPAGGTTPSGGSPSTSLRAGRWAERLESSAPPAYSASSASLEAKEAEEAKDAREKTVPPTLLAWFQEFLTRLPAVIEFRELAPGHGPALRSSKGVGGSRPGVVRFTEPRRGMTVDPASVELAERAEALAAEAGISYAEALAQLREEQRATPSTA